MFKGEINHLGDLLSYFLSYNRLNLIKLMFLIVLLWMNLTMSFLCH